LIKEPGEDRIKEKQRRPIMDPVFHFELPKKSLNPGEINGAIQFKDETITSTRIVINVSNLDEALEKVQTEGGKIFIPKKKIPGNYYSVIYDTEGNEIMLIERII
jgi:predicted enzyme related to lactoylglutathione lyase